MARAVVGFIAVGCLALASCGKPTFDRASLIGRWKKDDTKTIEFRADGTMTVVKDGVVRERRYEFRDGRRIVFDSNAGNFPAPQHIYVVGADGSGLTQLTGDANNCDFHADWSPDGSKLGFARHTIGVSHIDLDVMDVDEATSPRSGEARTVRPSDI